jgi:hypothetical protein
MNLFFSTSARPFFAASAFGAAASMKSWLIEIISGGSNRSVNGEPNSV